MFWVACSVLCVCVCVCECVCVCVITNQEFLKNNQDKREQKKHFNKEYEAFFHRKITPAVDPKAGASVEAQKGRKDGASDEAQKDKKKRKKGLPAMPAMTSAEDVNKLLPQVTGCYCFNSKKEMRWRVFLRGELNQRLSWSQCYSVQSHHTCWRKLVKCAWSEHSRITGENAPFEMPSDEVLHDETEDALAARQER